MTDRRGGIVALLSCAGLLLAGRIVAQDVPWSGPVRGTWVQTGPAAAGATRDSGRR